MKIYTIGHSTHPVDIFVNILKAYGIKQLVDIRTIPRSRHNPQYEMHALRDALGRHGIEYLWLEGLGGLRHTTGDSVNSAWRNKSFRGYADYMQTQDFTQALDELIQLAKNDTTAIMCAEAVPWRCHRSLVGDALLIREVEVVDILSEKSSQPHKITPFARVSGLEITYPEDKE